MLPLHGFFSEDQRIAKQKQSVILREGWPLWLGVYFQEDVKSVTKEGR